MQFVITQGYRNVAVLHYIKSLLGFGVVTKQGARTFRYVVQDKEGLRKIIELLHGNLVLEKRIEEMKRFVAAYAQKYDVKIEPKLTRYQPTRNDG